MTLRPLVGLLGPFPTSVLGLMSSSHLLFKELYDVGDRTWSNFFWYCSTSLTVGGRSTGTAGSSCQSLVLPNASLSFVLKLSPPSQYLSSAPLSLRQASSVIPRWLVSRYTRLNVQKLTRSTRASPFLPANSRPLIYLHKPLAGSPAKQLVVSVWAAFESCLLKIPLFFLAPIRIFLP